MYSQNVHVQIDLSDRKKIYITMYHILCHDEIYNIIRIVFGEELAKITLQSAKYRYFKGEITIFVKVVPMRASIKTISIKYH